MLPGKKYTPEEIVRIVLRHWWLVLLPFVVGTVGGVVVYKRLPVQYLSETLIMVVPQQVPDSYVRSTVTVRVEDRLLSINEHILSRSRLERIIHDLDLYPERRATGILEDVVRRMRSDISVRLEGKESFRVGFASSDPTTAQKVTERLAFLYIEENLRDRGDLADSTSQFLESQLEDAKQRLVEQEKRLEQYRRRHSGQLPSQLSGNLQVIQNSQMQLQAVGESINRARERRLLIERQIADAQTLPASVVLPGVPIALPSAEPQLTAAQQLETARTRLDEFKLRYTAEHPDVRALERTIRDLQVKADEEARRLPDSATDRPVPLSEVARLKRISDLEAELEVIDRQIAAGQVEEARLKTTIAEYQAKVEVVPTRESELVELTRDYKTLQETYSSLLTKREDSKLAANLEHQQIGQQFRVIDPASLPERPHNQRRRLLVMVGSALSGLAAGLALLGLLEYRDSSFRSEEDVLRVLSLPVLALVPVMGSRPVGRWRRWRPAVGASVIVGVLVILGSAALIVWTLQS